MGKDWVEDIRDLHEMQGVHTWMKTATDEQKKEFIKYRLSFLREELDETVQAYDDESPEEIVDGLIDLCVVAISTLDAFGVEVHASWDAVHSANMSKKPGIKEGRPNPLGLPDLCKPEGWVGPSHKPYTGIFSVLFGKG